MESKSIRVSKKTYDRLRDLAAESGTTMKAILDEAIKDYDEKEYWEQYYADYAALKADPQAWAEYQEELRLWDCTLMDGLEDFPLISDNYTSRRRQLQFPSE